MVTVRDGPSDPSTLPEPPHCTLRCPPEIIGEIESLQLLKLVPGSGICKSDDGQD
jgi:hypothetical protein